MKLELGIALVVVALASLLVGATLPDDTPDPPLCGPVYCPDVTNCDPRCPDRDHWDRACVCTTDQDCADRCGGEY
jgi:hypothetical protein